MPKGTMLRVAVAVALITPLTACGGMKSGAEEAVRDSLKDPESARFGEFYFNKKTKKGCLTVNAKNSMGGYTGDKVAQVQHEKDGWNTPFFSEFDQAFCRSTFADKAD